MEAATSAPAVGYTVEQVRAQQNDRIFRRAVQNLLACSKPVGSISRLPTGAFAASNLNVLLGSTGTPNMFFQLSWPEFRAWQRD